MIIVIYTYTSLFEADEIKFKRSYKEINTYIIHTVCTSIAELHGQREYTLYQGCKRFC